MYVCKITKEKLKFYLTYYHLVLVLFNNLPYLRYIIVEESRYVHVIINLQCKIALDDRNFIMHYNLIYYLT